MNKNNLSEDVIELYEMANLRPEKTGLPMVIWVLPQTKKERHWARIKVQTEHGNKVKEDKMTSVGFDEKGNITNFGGLNKKDFELVSQFITLNLEGLIKLWNDEIDPIDFASKIKKVNK
jgi:hypothetical protein